MPFGRKTDSTSRVPAATSTGAHPFWNKGAGGLWYPFVNSPSNTQRVLEILSLLIILASVPAWLGGVYGIFVCGYGVALGLLGLFAWPRRHTIMYLVFTVLFFIWNILVIIFTATIDQCVPFYNGTTFNGVTYRKGHYCGSNILAYIVSGILLALTLISFFFALKVAAEKRPEPGTLIHQSTTSTTSAPARM
ncbi:hypothetical protein PROFUN_04020 [Planoprotostelium fungivorum]|uniref:MARVEL domain-containing protein n=1 Tax=Planoprotostelium fungivorum TaxID=1890364 RepID=A0A2P6MY47_9EUKA|nr:hypothetical protein PROFUN_14922 [Planoprotostelium fungivorum]PRP88197.1 hypothetical protein PROFUN_04020 [Planoprotostelium fungivorum]